MRSAPLEIPGIVGQLVVDAPALGRPTVLVDGVPAPRLTGAWYELTTDEGDAIPVRVRGGSGMSPWTRLVVGDEVYATGPAPPWWLQVLAIAPVLAPLLGGGFGFLAAFLGVVGTWLVLRRPWSLAGRTTGVLVVVAVTFGLSYAVGRAVGYY